MQDDELLFFKNRLSKIEPLLALKQRHINSLLEITEAINYNMPLLALIRLYESILLAQIGVRYVKLMVKENNDEWKCVSEVIPPGFNRSKNEVYEKFKDTHYVTRIDEELYRGFEYVIPVLHKKSPIGFALVGSFSDNEIDTIEEKLKMIQTITNMILVANENKRLFKNQVEQMLLQRELKLAADIQNMLIPLQLLNNEYISSASFYKPHKNIGGDYYDLLEIDDNTVLFCVCDISGKGVPAALLMANFQANLRAIAAQQFPLDYMLHNLNTAVKQITNGEKYITIFLAKYDVSKSKLSYINAGHNPPVLINSDKSFTLLEKGSTIIGMFDNLPSIEIGEVDITDGAKLICFTDGLTETANEKGELFEMERLMQFLQENNNLDIEALNTKLIAEVNRFKGENDFEDDITLLSLSFHCNLKA